MILAVTGHRPDKILAGGRNAYDQSVYLTLVEFAGDEIEEHLPDLVVTGMALGWDQAVAHACVAAGVPFLAAIPFPGQDLMWDDRSRRHYQWLIGRAREVHTVNEERPTSKGEAAWMLHARNHWMVDKADHLLALHNSDRNGGTAECVRYAAWRNRPVTNVWHRWVEFAQLAHRP